jgi:hypothetical protein
VAFGPFIAAVVHGARRMVIARVGTHVAYRMGRARASSIAWCGAAVLLV